MCIYEQVAAAWYTLAAAWHKRCIIIHPPCLRATVLRASAGCGTTRGMPVRECLRVFDSCICLWLPAFEVCCAQHALLPTLHNRGGNACPLSRIQAYAASSRATLVQHGNLEAAHGVVIAQEVPCPCGRETQGSGAHTTLLSLNGILSLTGDAFSYDHWCVVGGFVSCAARHSLTNGRHAPPLIATCGPTLQLV